MLGVMVENSEQYNIEEKSMGYFFQIFTCGFFQVFLFTRFFFREKKQKGNLIQTDLTVVPLYSEIQLNVIPRKKKHIIIISHIFFLSFILYYKIR